MATRRPFVGGNWKMNTTRSTGVEIARAVRAGVESGRAPGVETVLFPPFVYLNTIAEELGGALALGGQDVWTEQSGAFTGEISADMLRDVGATWALAGHSERRHVLGEPDELVGKKTAAALKGGLSVVLCVGETLEQREAGETDEVNARQTRAGLAGVSKEQLGRIVIAYEPVWAIGTGKTATPEDAQNAHTKIRALIGELYDEDAAAALRLVYGGSVKPDNARELFRKSDIDGGLIGGASLKADDFLAICDAAAEDA